MLCMMLHCRAKNPLYGNDKWYNYSSFSSFFIFGHHFGLLPHIGTNYRIIRHYFSISRSKLATIAVVNSSSGKIEAIGAGRNRNGAKSFSYATFDAKSQRQIGSTAKPLFDYGPGIEYNNWSTYQIFVDEPYTYSNGKSISNFDGRYEGAITLRRALSNSRNIPALKAFQSIDNKKIVNLVTTVGITPEITNGAIHEAHAIGAFTGSNPLSMAGAYQIFSNGGYYYETYAVNKIILRDSDQLMLILQPKRKINFQVVLFVIIG